MRKTQKLLCVAAVLMLISTISVQAGDPFRKLGRGIVNAGFGALEIPIKVYDVNKEEGGLAAVTYGTLKGIGFFIAREVVGVVEIATFPIPLPGATDSPNESGWGYGPWMYPEFIVGPDHDIYNIVYQDLPVD